jgi:hypothetical protein
MKLLVVGGGGREHAIIKSLKKNPEVTEIFSLPGNGGIAADATCVAIGATDIEKIVAFAVENAIDYAVVAPDDPLVLGCVDALEAKGMDHAQLLGLAAPKPLCLIAGQFDNMDSWDMMCRAPGYSPEEGRLKIINHATGHKPPRAALEEGYAFLDRWLRN